MYSREKVADVSVPEMRFIADQPFYLFASSLPFLYVLGAFTPNGLDPAEGFRAEFLPKKRRFPKRPAIPQRRPRSLFSRVDLTAGGAAGDR